MYTLLLYKYVLIFYSSCRKRKSFGPTQWLNGYWEVSDEEEDNWGQLKKPKNDHMGIVLPI